MRIDPAAPSLPVRGDVVGEYEIVTVKSGRTSLRSVVHGETFHPVVGPEVEARVLHIEQQDLQSRCAAAQTFILWDVGLGAAANVVAAIAALRDATVPVEIHSFDKTTSGVEFALKHQDELCYVKEHATDLSNLLATLDVKISPMLRWRLHLGDFLEIVKQPSFAAPHAILYDPYSPGTNPEMWTLEHFKTLFARLSPDAPCLLTNYTRSTAMRVTLLLAGFFVGIGCSIGEKAETTVAANQLDLIQRPLDRAWLTRVRISSNAAPLRFAGQGRSPISDEDFERLASSLQFRN